MTATKKLFIAALLLAVGFGVARLMGRPSASWRLSPTDKSSAVARTHTKPAKSVGALQADSVVSDTRLVPDFSSSNPYQSAPTASAPITSPSSPNVANGGSDQVASPPLVTHDDHRAVPPTVEPRVKLRDEAPRPLDFSSREAAASPPPSFPPSAFNDTALAAPRAAAAEPRASGLTQAEFIPNSGSPAAMNASYSEPAGVAFNPSNVAPPPWPETTTANEPRTHIVVDGDSLEKLAGRYLDDPTLGHEIYEANRETLSSPDLLPIGAELVIPKRSNRSAFNSGWPQSSVSNNASLRAASHPGAGRVIPAPVYVRPRAQLLPPTPAH